ncbi:hypothetical protein [Castellaniella defragrans]|uniref:hypothetical protein n=1 Tax=Castellaniella defragrans TaxID=75697 RepID=UPI0011DDC4FD|nr:hypothetical protein [Castellaniella defragrans]
MAQNILAGLDAWLSTWPGAGGNLKKPETVVEPDVDQVAANDPKPASENMTFHDRAVGDTRAIPATVAAASLPAQENEWRPLADVYYRHHFGCLRCMAAGQNPHLDRCITGHPLWAAYRAAFRQSKRPVGHRVVNTGVCDGEK